MSDGPSYLVHQPDGTTFGPADVELLKEWVAAGVVTRATAVSVQGDEGKVPAAVVPGLFEPERQGQATTQPAEPMYQAHLASGTTDALTLADLGRMVEAGDVLSTTPISLVGGSKKVPAAVVPGLEDDFRRREKSAHLNRNPVIESLIVPQVESEAATEVEVQPSPDGLTTDSKSADVLDASQPKSDSDSPSVSSTQEIREFLFCLIASTAVSLLVCLAVIGLLTKIEFPVFGDRGWRSDATKEGLEQGVGHGWRGALWTLVVALVILVAVLVQRWGLNVWSCFLVPAIWLGIATTIVLMGSRGLKRDDCQGLGYTCGYMCGVGLGYWYAAILSAICFGPHPLAR